MGHNRLGHNGRQFLCDEAYTAAACIAPGERYPAKLTDPVQRASNGLDVRFQAGVRISGNVTGCGDRSRHGDAAGEAVARLVGRRVAKSPRHIAGCHSRCCGNAPFRVHCYLEIGPGRDPAVGERRSERQVARAIEAAACAGHIAGQRNGAACRPPSRCCGIAGAGP